MIVTSVITRCDRDGRDGRDDLPVERPPASSPHAWGEDPDVLRAYEPVTTTFLIRPRFAEVQVTYTESMQGKAERR